MRKLEKSDRKSIKIERENFNVAEGGVEVRGIKIRSDREESRVKGNVG